MVLSLRGDVWRRIKVEISPDEGQAGSSQEHVAAPKLAGFGLPTPDYLVGLAFELPDRPKGACGNRAP